jgi:AcrR family transcriptional regulator
MGRPKEIDRSRVLDEARRLFSSKGVVRTRVEHIAQGLGVGKSSLYYHFASKEAILQAVLHEETQQCRAQIEQAVALADSPGDKFRAYVHARMACVKQVAALFSAFEEDYLQHYAWIQRLRREYDAQEIALISGYLQQGRFSGDFRVRDVGLASATIVAALKGLEIEWVSRCDAANMKREIDEMLDMLFFGLVDCDAR